MADVGRNDPCPCGSGKKYKKCCETKDQTKQHATIEKQWQQSVKAKEKELEKEDAPTEKESGAPNVAANKPEAVKHAPPKHSTFVAPKSSMPRRTGGG